MPAYYLEFIIVALGIGILLCEAFFPPPDRRLLGYIAAGGLFVVFLLLLFATDHEPAASPTFANFLIFDSLAVFYKGFAIIATLIVILLSFDYLPVLRDGINGKEPGQGGLGEFFCLPLFACAGLMWMASAKNLIFLFLALELVAITFYIMVAIMRRNVGSLEAGVKYLILGALSTGFLVYGITWIFGITGTADLETLAEIAPGIEENTHALLFGLALLIVALGFKIGAAPFHVWIPDVYQGAPTPITAYLSVASKAAGVIVLIRVLDPFFANPVIAEKLVVMLLVMAAITLLAGNLAALAQHNFKRLLAYSSISHTGFLLIGIAAQRADLVSLYLAVYMPMTFLAFWVMAWVRTQTGREDLDAFNGLHQRNPFAAFAMLVAAAALAGVPLTAGFVGKFAIFYTAVDNHYWTILIIAIIGATAGFYYYLKIVRHMYWNEPDSTDRWQLSHTSKTAMGALVVAIFFLGVYPLFTNPLEQLTDTNPEILSIQGTSSSTP